jgi:hypothetical protein
MKNQVGPHGCRATRQLTPAALMLP